MKDYAHLNAAVSDMQTSCSVLQLLPLRFRAARGISSTSVETDAVFPRGGSAMGRTTVGTGLTRPSVQVHSPFKRPNPMVKILSVDKLYEFTRSINTLETNPSLLGESPALDPFIYHDQVVVKIHK